MFILCLFPFSASAAVRKDSGRTLIIPLHVLYQRRARTSGRACETITVRLSPVTWSNSPQFTLPWSTFLVSPVTWKNPVTIGLLGFTRSAGLLRMTRPLSTLHRPTSRLGPRSSAQGRALGLGRTLFSAGQREGLSVKSRSFHSNSAEKRKKRTWVVLFRFIFCRTCFSFLGLLLTPLLWEWGSPLMAPLLLLGEDVLDFLLSLRGGAVPIGVGGGDAGPSRRPFLDLNQAPEPELDLNLPPAPEPEVPQVAAEPEQQPNPLTIEELRAELKVNVKRLRYWQGHRDKVEEALRISVLKEQESNRRKADFAEWMAAVKPELQRWGVWPPED